jgi:prepilin-type N-terminal cleavage/methylation domain-containing protein
MLRRAGVTLVEMLVVIAILAVLMAVIWPIFARVKDTANQAACITNLRMIGTALAAYKQDHQGMYYPASLAELVNAEKGTLDKKILNCPKDPDKNADSYSPAYNYYGFAPSTGMEPIPLKSLDEATNVYGGNWTLGKNYDEGVMVLGTDGKFYICTTSHTAAAGNQPVTGGGYSANWTVIEKRYWNSGSNTPDADFPALCNTNPPANTIVTACPHHGNGKYMILRVDGANAILLKPATTTFWELSETGK